MAALTHGVAVEALDSRIMEKLAVVDLTTTKPLLSEGDLSHLTDTPWGVNGFFGNTQIWHIQGGYHQQQEVTASGEANGRMVVYEEDIVGGVDTTLWE